ncbi:hypothetical protein Tco_1123445 [Tanacetum coccineum]|uniref:Uncharacterized protein n=1 Tax=Tanacetum coccineum TaxID=301880 RepID=A0ABQ5J4U2_9ASTR
MSWFMRCSWCGGPFNSGNCRRCTNVSFRDEFVLNPDPISYDETPDFSYTSTASTSIDHQPPKEISIRELLLQEKLHKALQDVCEKLNQQEQETNVSTHTPVPSRRFNIIYNYDDDDDDNEENTIPLNEIITQIPLSIAITPILPTLEPEDSLSMGDEHLSTIPEKESDKFIKSSVEDLVPIPSEFEDTSDSDSECDLPFCDNFVTFSNPLFKVNDDFTSSDDELLLEEDVPKKNFKIYSNPLFEFDDEYISSDVNPLFNEVLEDIEIEDSYVSKLDEPDLLVTPLSAFNEDECFDPGGDVDEIELLLHRDPSTPKISVTSILEGFTDEPPLVENDDLFDLESKENERKKILYDVLIDDLMTEDKVFDPGIPENFFSPTYVKLPFEDRHYISLTYSSVTHEVEDISRDSSGYCKLKSQLWGMSLQYRVCHIEFSPSVVITNSRQNASLLLPYGDGLYAFNLWMVYFYFFFYEATSQFQNLLTIRMLVWGEADSEISTKRSR